jgi:hypothetical protein
LPPDPSFIVQALALRPTEIVGIDWTGDGGKILGRGASLRFDLDPPRFISGLRFRLSVVDPDDMMPAVRVQLRSETRRELLYYNCRYESTTGEEAEILVYVDDRISRLLIYPNNRVSSFHISSLELLLPQE